MIRPIRVIRGPSSGLDFERLAARFDVTGATIRDAAVGAAFLAAADGGVTTMAHVEAAIGREYAKLGRLPVERTDPPPSRTGKPASCFPFSASQTISWSLPGCSGGPTAMQNRLPSGLNPVLRGNPG